MLQNYAGKKLAAEGRLRLARSGLEYELHPERKGAAPQQCAVEPETDDLVFDPDEIDVDEDGSIGSSAAGDYNRYGENGDYAYAQADLAPPDAEQDSNQQRPQHSSAPAYPYQFVTRGLTKTRSFEEFCEFRAVVLFPYDMDLITFYEFYQMNIPLFLPAHLSNPDAVFKILQFTDYFRYPGVQYFVNIPDLLHALVGYNPRPQHEHTFHSGAGVFSHFKKNVGALCLWVWLLLVGCVKPPGFIFRK
eukprot:g15375.t1